MSLVLFFKRAWQVITVAGTLAWVASLGLGTVVAAVLASLLSLAQPWRSFFFVGVFLLVAAASLPVARAGFVALAQRLPSEKPATFRDLSALSQQERGERAREKLKRDQRAAIHEVITTLEHHRHVIERGHNRNPGYQGEWGENRSLFAGDSHYDNALRATERTFQAIQFAPSSDALAAIDEALTEWNERLRVEH